MLWEVFYSPHTDDETIGMAGSILRAQAAGHKTLVILVTDNQPSTRGIRLFPDENTFVQRRAEWIHAMSVLGVSETHCWELSERDMIEFPQDMISRTLELMQLVDSQYKVVHHHTVWGANDVHVEASLPTVSHVVCAEAAREFARLHRLTRVSLHAVYIYSEIPMRRSAPVILQLTPVQIAMKTAALNCYKHGIGYGYASVPELIDGAAVDPCEYIQEVPHDTDRVD